jgi:hypothetical protein
MTRIAYFITLHHCPYQFEWLMNAIWNPEDIFLVHVDAKSLMGIKRERRGTFALARHWAASHPNVRLMRPRCTNWGGWSLSALLLDAIRIALRVDSSWGWFVNLSGQCYPLKPLNQIRSAVGSSDQVYVEMRPWETLPPDDWHLRWHPMIESPFRAHILPGRRRPPKDFVLRFKGSQWVILPRDFCEWVLKSELLPRLKHYFAHLLLTDELLIQTLLANGPFADRVAPHYGREILIPGQILTSEHRDRLLASPALFARKFDAKVDRFILTDIAEHCGFRPGPLP